MQNSGRKLRRLTTLSGLIILIGLSGGCQFFQEVTREESPVARLEKRVSDMEVEFGHVDKSTRDREIALRSEYASLKAEIDGLRSELQSLRGELESLSYQLNRHAQAFEREGDKQEERISALAKNFVGRITVIENYLGFERSTGVLDISDVKTTTTGTTEAGSAETLYKVALQLFEAGDYEAARRSFEKLLETWPESPLCNNARFWIGESHYREHWYEKAILEYQKVIDDYPQGNKVPAALLKQGLAFGRINDDTSARLVLNKLIESFPGSHEAEIAEKSLKKL